jgi:hypothetical protein
MMCLPLLELLGGFFSQFAAALKKSTDLRDGENFVGGAGLNAIVRLWGVGSRRCGARPWREPVQRV